MATSSISEKWIPFFTSHFRVIAPEQMGHGRTADLVDRPFHYHDMAEDTVALMHQLGIERADVVGYSDGGIIGLDLAIHHPERVNSLAVTGANARFEGYTAENQECGTHLRSLSASASDDYASPLSRRRRALARRSRTSETHVGRSSRASRTRSCERIEAPTLLIIGDDDIVMPEHAVEMFRTIPRAQLCVVPNAGRGPMPSRQS